MNRSDSLPEGYARQGWIAFCSGWWLAGIVLGFRHFLDLIARPSLGVPEAVGVSVVMGSLLPGGAPFWYAANIVGARGLPVGFTGLLLGAVMAVIVWVTLPLALSSDGNSQPAQPASRLNQVVVAVPYLAAGAGLAHLFGTFRARGQTPLRAGVLALVTAAIAYLIVAAVVFIVSVLFPL